MTIADIRITGLSGGTVEGGWAEELTPEDNVHTIVEVIADSGLVGVGSTFVEYSPEKAASVVAESPRDDSRKEGDIAIKVARNTTSDKDYPVVLVSYALACTKYADAAKGELVKGFLTYIASKEGQQAAADNAGSAPLSDKLRTDVEASIQAIGGA